MEKPITIKREDFIKNIVEAVNNSGLPVNMVADVMTQIATEVQRQAQAQLAKDKEEWAKAQESES